MPIVRIQLANARLQEAGNFLAQARNARATYAYTHVVITPVIQRQEKMAVLALKKARSLIDEAITALNGQDVEEDERTY